MVVRGNETVLYHIFFLLPLRLLSLDNESRLVQNGEEKKFNGRSVSYTTIRN